MFFNGCPIVNPLYLYQNITMNSHLIHMEKQHHVFVSRFSINDCPILSHLNILKSPCFFFPLFHPFFHNLDLLIRGPPKIKKIFTSSIPQFWWISYWENNKSPTKQNPDKITFINQARTIGPAAHWTSRHGLRQGPRIDGVFSVEKKWCI